MKLIDALKGKYKSPECMDRLLVASEGMLSEVAAAG